MKLTMKDLGGKKMVVEVEPSSKIGDVKVKVQELNGDLEVARQKIIHKGKVLKDDDTVESTGVTEADFFVCMVSAKPKAATARPTPPPAPATATASSITTPTPPSATATSASSSSSSSAATATSAPAPAPTPAQAPVAVDPAQVESLVSMGFPEAQVRAALEATQGNPDAAYGLLESGAPIQPPQMQRAAPTGGSSNTGSTTAPGQITTLEQFRSHPQFDNLRRLVQTNPGSLDQVLQLIGQQSPQLLQVILQQQDAFIAMMNEPIPEGATTTATSGATTSSTPTTTAGGAPGGMPAFGGMEGMGGLDQGPTPQQLAQILQAMPEQQRIQLLSSMTGIPPEQVSQFSGQLIQALASGGLGGGPMGGMGRLPGVGAMGGAPPPGGHGQGGHRIELTPEEAANLNQLVDMGFDRNEALQVFLAVGKNVEMAASILFESAEGGGPGVGGQGQGGSDSGTGGGDSDQMY